MFNIRYCLVYVSCVILVGTPSNVGEGNAEKDKYYDARERRSENLTFEWVSEAHIKMDRVFYEQINLARLEQARRTGSMPALIDAEKFAEKVYNISCNYLVIREGDSSMMTIHEQNINLEQSEIDYYTNTFYKSGNKVLYLSFDRESKIQSAKLLDYIGMPNDFSVYFGLNQPSVPRPPFDSNILVFYMGFSPLRLFNVALKDWEMVDVSPDEWVFNLREGTVRHAKKVSVRLSRRHGDAPKVIEIEYIDGRKHVFRTKRFSIYFGEWFAAEVEELFQSGYQVAFTKHVLQKVARTLPNRLRLEIPKGTPTHIWTIEWSSEGGTEIKSHTLRGWDNSLIKGSE